jgi:hypothetical protein
LARPFDPVPPTSPPGVEDGPGPARATLDRLATSDGYRARFGYSGIPNSRVAATGRGTIGAYMTNVARKYNMSGAFGSRAGRPVRGRSEDAPDGVRDGAAGRPRRHREFYHFHRPHRPSEDRSGKAAGVASGHYMPCRHVIDIELKYGHL